LAVVTEGIRHCPLRHGPLRTDSSGNGDTEKNILQRRQNLPDRAEGVLNRLAMNSFLPQSPAWPATGCATLHLIWSFRVGIENLVKLPVS
jgi:hypothetical protein